MNEEERNVAKTTCCNKESEQTGIDAYENEVEQHMKCPECGREWTNIFEFTETFEENE